jgi:hypothetical protein
LNVRIGDEDELGTFIFRTTGFNSIRTLAARLRYFHAVSGGLLACMPLALKLRGKSTTQSYRAAIFYADITVRDGMTLEAAIAQARETHVQRQAVGFDRLDPYKEVLEGWLRTDSHRPKRDRRTAKALFLLLQARGYRGSYSQVARYTQVLRASEAQPSRKAFVPMRFAPGEAFQFDWSCEYAVIGGKCANDWRWRMPN